MVEMQVCEQFDMGFEVKSEHADKIDSGKHFGTLCGNGWTWIKFG